jgi:hypothetical protein
VHRLAARLEIAKRFGAPYKRLDPFKGRRPPVVVINVHPLLTPVGRVVQYVMAINGTNVSW